MRESARLVTGSVALGITLVRLTSAVACFVSDAVGMRESARLVVVDFFALRIALVSLTSPVASSSESLPA